VLEVRERHVGGAGNRAPRDRGTIGGRAAAEVVHRDVRVGERRAHRHVLAVEIGHHRQLGGRLPSSASTSSTVVMLPGTSRARGGEGAGSAVAASRCAE
jgi:hypothetical protein